MDKMHAFPYDQEKTDLIFKSLCENYLRKIAEAQGGEVPEVYYATYLGRERGFVLSLENPIVEYQCTPRGNDDFRAYTEFCDGIEALIYAIEQRGARDLYCEHLYKICKKAFEAHLIRQAKAA